MDTQKKLYLLPHRCQLIGWILVGVSLVFAIGSMLFIKGQSNRETYAGMGIIFSFIGLFLAGLSRERQEDEFTVFLRTRSALTAVAFMFAFRILLVLIMLTMGMLTTMNVIGEEVFLDNRTVALSFMVRLSCIYSCTRSAWRATTRRSMMKNNNQNETR